MGASYSRLYPYIPVLVQREARWVARCPLPRYTGTSWRRRIPVLKQWLFDLCMKIDDVHDLARLPQGCKPGLELYFLSARILDSLNPDSPVWSCFVSVNMRTTQIVLLIVVSLCFKYIDDWYATIQFKAIVDVSGLTGVKFTYSDIYRVEKCVLQHVDYNLQIPTLYDYVTFIIADKDLNFSNQRVLWFLAVAVSQSSHFGVQKRLQMIVNLYVDWCTAYRGVSPAKIAPLPPFESGIVHSIKWDGVVWKRVSRSAMSETDYEEIDCFMANETLDARTLGRPDRHHRRTKS